MDCTKCNVTFANKQSLKYHIDHEVCERKPQRHICQECEKEFSTKQMLGYHTRYKVCKKHPSRHICSLCKKEFSTKNMLKYHEDHRVCSKKFCEYCEEGIDDDWHQERCRVNYDLEDVICYDHGDIAERCCKKDIIKALVRREKTIDQRFCIFDDLEGTPWEDRTYWMEPCKKCGNIREGQHIWQCLAVEEGPPITFKAYVRRLKG